MTIAVTGANGFIGRAICALAVARGDTCIGIVRRAQAAADLPPGVAPVVIGDYTDEAAVRAQLPQADCLVHAAGRAHVLAGDLEADAYHEANVHGPRVLAQAAGRLGYRRFLFMSSIGVLGKHDAGTPFTEESAPDPAWSYAVSKLQAEQALFEIGQASGLEITALRPPMVYGPGNRGNFPRLMQWVRSGLPIPLGRVRNARSYVYVDNLADAALLCARHPNAANRLFLVGDEGDWSTPDMVRLIAREMERPARLWPVPIALLRLAGRLTGKSREVHSLTDSLRIDSSALRAATGWSPPLGTCEGVARTVRWFMTQAPRGSA
jgi:UDP-glucose 4-epimerase